MAPHDAPAGDYLIRRVARIALRTRYDLDRIDTRDERADRSRAAAQAPENPVLEIRIALAASAAGPVSTDRN